MLVQEDGLKDSSVLDHISEEQCIADELKDQAIQLLR